MSIDTAVSPMLLAQIGRAIHDDIIFLSLEELAERIGREAERLLGHNPLTPAECRALAWFAKSVL